MKEAEGGAKRGGGRTFRKLLELRRGRHPARLDRSANVDRVLLLLGRDERDARSLVARSTCPTGSVDVVLHVVGDVVVDDESELLDVQTSRGDRRRNHDWDHTRLEVRQRLISVDLLLAAVKRVGPPVGPLVEFEQEVVGRFLPFDKDERSFLVQVGLGLVRLSEEFEQAVELGLLRSDLDDLGDLLGDDRPTTDGDLERLDEELSREGVHLFGECGREENDLTIRPDVVDDFHNLRKRGSGNEVS